MSGLDEKLLPCPFCGGAAVLEMAIPCHSGAWVQCVECDAQSCSFAGKDADDSDATAIAAWNRRASATPADVGELVARLRAPHSVDTWHAAQTAAAALERVVRERDEAHLRTAYLEEEVVRTRDAAVERVRTAEAKLAEARKVIERIRSEASSWHASYSFARLIADIARRFLEETK